MLSHGADRLTTTRVANRAGVSVGTLYQYYPNKRSLLYAVMKEHLDKVAAAVEAACKQACDEPLTEMIKCAVEVFVDAKMDRADISVALYQVAPDVGGPALVKRAGQRMRKALEAMLHTAPNIQSPPDGCAIDTLLAAMSGVMLSIWRRVRRRQRCGRHASNWCTSVREGPNPNKLGHLGCGKASKNYTFITMPQKLEQSPGGKLSVNFLKTKP